MDKGKPHIEAKRDLGLSTDYDDQKHHKCGTRESRLDALTNNLDIEITLAGGNIIKMEKLEERYYIHCFQSIEDDDMGFHMRYLNAHDRIKTLVASFYAPFRPVLNDGSQNAS
jgi:hypothetical protein